MIASKYQQVGASGFKNIAVALIAAGIFINIMIYTFDVETSATIGGDTTVEAIQNQQQQIQKQFSSWDGSHIKLERLVKNAMKDSSSFDHVSTKHWVYDDFILVKMTYRGKNSFDATITDTQTAKYSIDGTLIELQ